MKKLLSLLFLFSSILANANMAEPIDRRGSSVATPYISQYVDVKHEKINIKIDKDFNTADFYIQYNIEVYKDGSQIPLLFYAKNLTNNFRVFLDGQEIPTQKSPQRYGIDTTFTDFHYLFGPLRKTDSGGVEVSEMNNKGVMLKDLIYFEANLKTGQHRVEVYYTAKRWRCSVDGVNEYSFQYSLSPASYWLSFGDLDVNIDLSEFKYPITTNLPPLPIENNQMQWYFNRLPNQDIVIYYNPDLGFLAGFFAWIGAGGFAMFMGIVLFFLYTIVIKAYRQKYPQKRFSWAVILGSLLIPLLFMLSWFYGYDLVDYMIGPHASREHGYATLLVLFMYPIAIPFYAFSFWMMDKRFKRSVSSLK